jgi:hypothetical protein
MIQIEELGKLIAQIINNRNTGSTLNNPQLIQSAYTTLHADRNTLLELSPEALRQLLDRDDSGGLQRMDIAAHLLIEEAHLVESPVALQQKALEILEYIHLNDRTFSINRACLIEEIRSELNR